MSKDKLAALVAAKPNIKVKFDISTRVEQRWQPNIHAATSDAATISIYEQIGYDAWDDIGVDAKRIDAALRAIGDGKDIVVNINSPGGDVFEGIAIYNLLRNYNGTITVKIVGVAASAASIIAMAGDEIQIAKSAFIMIHNCWSYAFGNQHDMREAADYLAVFDDNAADIYADRANLAKDEIIKMLDDETWLSGEQAIQFGFADKYLSADQVETTNETTSQANARKLERVLAEAGMTRSERRKLIQSIKADTPCATSDSTPCAAETVMPCADEPVNVATGAISNLSKSLLGVLS